MIDIGLNITSKQFNNDKEEIIKTAIKNGIYDFIFTGTSLENSLRSQQFIKDNNIGYFTAGLHPHNAKDWIFYSENSTYNKIKKMSSDKKLVAIGEVYALINFSLVLRNTISLTYLVFNVYVCVLQT